MTDWLKVWLLSSAVVCWLIGGTGHKWVRRWGWPYLALLLLSIAHSLSLKLVVMFVSLVVVCHLGYGDGTSWPKRVAVFTSYALPSLWLSWHLWWLRLLLCTGFPTLMFWLSRRVHRVDHKLFESSAGLVQAWSLVIA